MNRRNGPERFFAIPRYAGKATTSTTPSLAEGIRPWDDFSARYLQDDWMEELGPNASVWGICNEENERFDAEMVGGWRDTADVLLVFVGLRLSSLEGVISPLTNSRPAFSQL